MCFEFITAHQYMLYKMEKATALKLYKKEYRFLNDHEKNEVKIQIKANINKKHDKK